MFINIFIIINKLNFINIFIIINKINYKNINNPVFLSINLIDYIGWCHNTIIL